MFPYFKVSGAPLTRGQEIGKKAKKQIHYNIKAYQDLFSRLENIRGYKSPAV